jgi:methylmalonyl-CoA mutase N-terminal domain/subunit
MGGTQSLHTNSLDEAYALPGERAVTLALRTQQIIAHETGVAQVADPLGGSHFVEALTDEVERRALDYIRTIDAMGGMIAAIEQGYPQAEIADASYRYQRELEREERVTVGVNRFTQTGDSPIEVLRIDESAERSQVEKLKRLRAGRDGALVQTSLDRIRREAEGETNLIPALLEAVRAYATVGEISTALGDIYGWYRETAAV